MGSCYLMLTALLMSPFSFWTCVGSASLQDHSRTAEGDPALARGFHPHVHHRYNSTLPNVNATNVLLEKFSQLTNALLNELNPAASELLSNALQSTTSVPLTTTETSDWDDWDLDDFDSCRDVMRSVIRRLTMRTGPQPDP